MKNIKDVKICIVGLGYVGLPLAIAFAEKCRVIGFDINFSRLSELQEDYDRTLEIHPDKLKLNKENIIYSSDIQSAKDCNVYIITVPTPIDSEKKPNLNILRSACKDIASLIKKDSLIIFESTVYPGATEEVCVPILELYSDLKFNKDFFCGYSPERINPGDKKRKLEDIVKVTSGSNKSTALKVDKLYKKIIKAGTYLAPSIKVAEASKIIENVQRDVNISLMNELAIIFNKIGIDTSDVLKASSTKWNFLNFKPGLVGGHCIGVDPYYLAYKAKQLNYTPNVILS